MIPRKPFIYFLLDTATGKVYYRDAGGILQTLIIAAGINTDVSLKNAPGNWLDTLLEFIRNTTYEGMNRAYSTPMDFIGDAQQMITELFLLGYGTEASLTLATFKYNDKPVAGEPQYLLYFKGPADLYNIENKLLESVSVNIMEGGAAQLLKNYESTPLEIPCDGSIAENKKIHFDGLLVENIVYWELQPTSYNNGDAALPMNIVSQEGDSYGAMINDQSLQDVGPGYWQASSNSPLWFNADTVVKIKGNITINALTAASTPFRLFTSTSKTTPNSTLPIPLFGLSYTKSLFPYHPASYPIANNQPFQGFFQGRQTFYFDTEVPLAAYEKLFFIYSNVTPGMEIISGNIQAKFSTKAKPTRAWAITLYDAFKIAWEQINKLASTNGLNYNFAFTSQYLQQKLNLFITSGDALRASGDSSYNRFFSNIQTGQTIHQTFGPVIKVTLKQLYEAAKVILCGMMGTGHNGTGETLFFESYGTVYNSSVIDFSIGEVAGLGWSFNKDRGFSDLSLGYQPQSYDQKAGKYEYNTTLKMKAPINSFEKTLDLVTSVRTDPYGIEKLRSNLGNTTSTTRNDSDNSVFLINVDTANSVYDFFKADFISLIQDPNSAINTNNHLPAGFPAQSLQLPLTDGEYFQPANDNGIVVFSEAGYNAVEACNLTITGIANSENRPPLAPPDSYTIKLWRNGVVIYQQTAVISAVNQAIAINNNFAQLWQYKDCTYITLETTATAKLELTFTSLTIGAYVAMTAGFIPVDAGTFRKLLSWLSFIPTSVPYVVGNSRVQYGYQYFLFNSLVPNSIFDMNMVVKGFIEGNLANCTIEVYINGILQAENIVIAGSVARIGFTKTLSAIITRAYSLGDVVFVAVYTSASSVQFTEVEVALTSNYIQAYDLKRVQYTSLIGIPNIAKDSAGNIRSDIAGAPYNIEELTPGYLRDVVWADYFKSCFMDMVRGDLIFQTLNKNPYLSRSYANGTTITENDNKPILNANRLWYPIIGKTKSNVPIRFAELMGRTINAHVHATFMGVDIYFFANKAGQKPALNESQEWVFQLSPLTDLQQLANITSFKLPDMANNSLNYSHSCPVQLVPYNQPILDQYHTRNRDQFLFEDQIARWMNKDNYGQLRQIGDLIPLHHISNGLDPISYEVIDYKTKELIYGPINLDTIPAAAVPNPKVLWQKYIDTADWVRGNYQIIVKGFNIPMWKSEPQLVREKWECEDTVLLEYTHSSNTQGIVFNTDTPFKGSMRFKGGYSNMFEQKYIAKTFIDQPQDIIMLNGIPYEVGNLYIAPVPDYMMRKIMRALMMDGATMDGEGFTLNDGAEPEQVFTKGAPKKIYRLKIRPSTAKASTTVVAGIEDTDNSMIVSVNPQSFGPNVTNSSGTTTVDLIDIIVGV